jgi:phage terminase Nu1 subunit (DNA packaging protein)
MEIQSAFNSGVQGLQRSTEVADQAAADIVAQTTAAQEADVVNQAPENTDRKVPDLNQSIVDLKVAEHQAKASTEVIKTADDSLGTLLDVTA